MNKEQLEQYTDLMNKSFYEYKDYDEAFMYADWVSEDDPNNAHAWLIKAISLGYKSDYYSSRIAKADRYFHIGLNLLKSKDRIVNSVPFIRMYIDMLYWYLDLVKTHALKHFDDFEYINRLFHSAIEIHTLLEKIMDKDFVCFNLEKYSSYRFKVLESFVQEASNLVEDYKNEHKNYRDRLDEFHFLRYNEYRHNVLYLTQVFLKGLYNEEDIKAAIKKVESIGSYLTKKEVTLESGVIEIPDDQIEVERKLTSTIVNSLKESIGTETLFKENYAKIKHRSMSDDIKKYWSYFPDKKKKLDEDMISLRDSINSLKSDIGKYDENIKSLEALKDDKSYYSSIEESLNKMNDEYNKLSKIHYKKRNRLAIEIDKLNHQKIDSINEHKKKCNSKIDELNQKIKNNRKSIEDMRENLKELISLYYREV